MAGTRRSSRRCSPGARLDAVDQLEKNAMTYAAGEGRTEIVLLFIGRGVDPNAVYRNDLTALMWAAGNGKADTVKALLARGREAGPEGQSRQDRARHGARERSRRRHRGAREGLGPRYARS